MNEQELKQMIEGILTEMSGGKTNRYSSSCAN